MAATTGSINQFRQRVGKSACAHVVYRQNGIGRAHRRATIDDFLRTALDFRVSPLHGIEIEIGYVRPGIHARGRAAAHADQHARTADLHQQRTRWHGGLERLHRGNGTDPAGQHDRLVVAAHFAVDRLFESAEIAAKIRTTEFVVERRAADGTFEHDLERGRDTFRLADGFFLPRLFETGDAQMGNGIPGQPGLRLGAATRGPLVTDLATGTGGGAGERRDRGRVVVRFHLHQDVRLFGGVPVRAGRVRIKTLDLGTFHNRSIVGVSDYGSRRMRCVRMANHAEQ